MPEKEKTTSNPMSDAEYQQLWQETAQKIFLNHLPMGRAQGFDTLAREAFATAKLFADVAGEVRDGNATLPEVRATNTPAPMVEVRYEDPENPGQYVTRLEAADLDVTMPNLPADHPQSQRCLTDPRHEKKQLAEAR